MISVVRNDLQTILVVDDNVDTLGIMEVILIRFGYKVILARDGRSALSHFTDVHSVNLVITDYQMPGMNGLEFVSRLQHIAPEVPVIMASMFIRTDVYLKALALNVAEFLEKPVKPEALKLVVENILNLQQAYPLNDA
jgi:DNA-binding NtrC family response regulator